MASLANTQPRRAARWEHDHLDTRRHQDWTPRDLTSSHDAWDSSYQHSGPLRFRAQPLSEETFLEMQRNLMQHIMVLEVLIGLLLFAIVVVGGIVGLRWRSESRSGGRRGSFRPLPSYHGRNSSAEIVPLPFHMQQMHLSSTPTLSPHYSSPAVQQPGKSTLNSAGYHTTPSGKTLPKTPPSASTIYEQLKQPHHKAPASATSISSTSTTRAPNDPFASPAQSSRSLPIQQPLPTPMSMLPAYPTSQLAHGGDHQEERMPAPLKPAQDTASLLDEELGPSSSSSTSRYANPNGVPLPGKKSARQMSIPRSAWGGSSGTAPTDVLSASGTNASGAYPTVSNYLSRLQATSRRELTQYTSGLTAQGWTTLDSLRGITSSELRDAVRGMTTTDSEFLARSVQQELDWIDADSVRGGMGFRMVLSS